MVGAIGLQCFLDGVPLPVVGCIAVVGDGIVSKIDCHIDLGLLNSLEYQRRLVAVCTVEADTLI